MEKHQDTEIVDKLIASLDKAGARLAAKPLDRSTLVDTVNALVGACATARENNEKLRAALKAAL